MSRAGTHIDPMAPHRPHGPTARRAARPAVCCAMQEGWGGGLFLGFRSCWSVSGSAMGSFRGICGTRIWGCFGVCWAAPAGVTWGPFGEPWVTQWGCSGIPTGPLWGPVGVSRVVQWGYCTPSTWVWTRNGSGSFWALCAAGPGLGGSGGALGFLRGPPGPDLLAFLGTPRAAAAPGPRGVPRRGGGHPGMPAARLIGPPRGRPGQRTRPTSAPFGVPPPVSGPPLRDTPAAALGSRRGAAVAPSPRASAPRRPLSRRAVPRRGRPPRPPRRRPRRRCPRSPSAARGGAAPPRNDVSLPGRGPRLPRRLRPSLPGEAAAAWPGPAGRRGRGGGGCCC